METVTVKEVFSATLRDDSGDHDFTTICDHVNVSVIVCVDDQAEYRSHALGRWVVHEQAKEGT